jgi:hypothetical protein
MNGSAAAGTFSLGRLRGSPRLVALAAAGFAVYSMTGCLSNEYRIPKEELNRLVELPPASRGQRVHVIQGLGQRDGDPLPPDPVPDLYLGAHVDMDLDLPGSHGGHQGGPRTPAPGGNWRAPTAPPASAPSSGGAAPARSGWRSGGGGGNLSLPSGGGGGGGKGEELAILAVLVAAVAAFAVVGLAASEGARFDGYTQLHPEQLIHLKNSSDQELTLPLATLSRAEVELASEATVMDNEGFGLRLLERRPLDRVGGTFKVTVGSLLEPPPAAAPQQEWSSGITSTIQVGAFATQWFGVLGSLSLGGGTDALGQSFQRHGVGLELQAFPLRAGPLSLGAFGHGGLQLVGDSAHDFTSGPALGGGVQLELALTTRLAFSLRGDWTAARLDGRTDWTGNGTITAGLAIY